MTTRAGPPVIIGRDAELAAVSALLAGRSKGAAARGGGVRIEGEAGIGKTTLLQALVEGAEEQGWATISARCTESDEIRQFGSLLDVLDCRLQHPDPTRRRVAESLVADVDPIIDPFRLDVDAAWRLPVQEAIADLVLEMADRGPTLVAVDDLQWADTGTAGVLLTLARHTRSTPLLLVWTRRSSAPSVFAEQLGSRLSESLVSFQLDPLDPSAIRRLAAAVLGYEPGEAEDARLDAAGGNPFFLGALLSNGKGATRTEAVRRWVEDLPTTTGDALTTAAVIGREFDIGVLGAVTRRASADLVDVVEPGVRAGILLPLGGGRFAFSHDLVREGFSSGLPAALRAALHREIGTVLAASGADLGVVAQHLARGARPGDETAAEQIRHACQAVVRNSAAAAAELLAQAAAVCTPGSVVWAEVMADRVVALQWSGQAVESLAVADEAIAQSLRPAQRSRARMVRATSLGLVGNLPAASVEYRAVADDPTTPPPLRALVLAELATQEAWGVDRAAGRADAEEALTIASEVGAMQAELQARCALTTMALFDGLVREAIDLARDAVLLGRSHGSLSPAREVYLALALANADDHDEAAIWFAKGQRDAEAVSDLWLVSRYQLARMSAEVLTGAWDSVLADAEAVVSLHLDTGMSSGMPQAPAAAGLVAVRRGASDEVVHRYRELASGAAGPGAELPGLLFHAWFEGLFAEREGRVEDAAGTLLFAHDTVVGMARLVQVWIAPDVVRTLLAAGDLPRATDVADQLQSFADEVVRVASARGTAALCRGLVAKANNDGRASELLARAADELRTARRLPTLLQALEARGPSGPGQTEAQQLRVRLGIATPGDARPGRGGPPSAAPRAAFGRLTPTEQRVAQRIAKGLANPAIAGELGLSKLTVE